jgi:hypothetical protein
MFCQLIKSQKLPVDHHPVVDKSEPEIILKVFRIFHPKDSNVASNNNRVQKQNGLHHESIAKNQVSKTSKFRQGSVKVQEDIGGLNQGIPE